MRTSSAKAKGRRACQEAKELLHKYAPTLHNDDIVVTPSGVTGPDLYLSPAARKVFPFAVECKNQEALNIWNALDQTHSHTIKAAGSTGLLVFRRNRSELFVAMKFEDFLNIFSKPKETL